MSNVIEMQNIHKSIHGNPILHNINLTIKNGEFLTLLGPSGCGKTSLLRLISGFDEPNQGRIFIDQKDVSGLPPHKRQVNTVFQNYALFPHMTVFENVAFGLKCQKKSREEIQDRVQNVLKMVKLENFSSRKPDQLSGGQQQRVAIARAVVNRPLVLLLDEPLSSLDYRLRKNMQIELKQLQRKLGITFIFVTHDQEEALSMSDRVVIMEEGVVEQVGTPREVYEEPRNLKVAQFIGEVNIFPAHILNIDGKFFTVDVLGKKRLVRSKGHFTIGQKMNVLVRPEDIRVWDSSEIEDQTEDLFSGKVEEVIYKGTTVDLIVRLDSGKIVSATEFFDEDDEKLEYTIGEKVWIAWPPGWEFLLPYEETH